jgi:putative transposase
VFDPFNMSRLEVWWAGRKVGIAAPQVIGRHAHPKAPPDEDPEPVRYTGIDYLTLITQAEHDATHGPRLHLANITDPDHHHPQGDGQ